MVSDISQIRREYAGKFLSEKQVGADPLILFKQWFDEANHAEVIDANAMTLSTIDTEGRPQGRIVLLKGVENGRFIFYTNYNSNKGQDLEVNPVAALTFYYKELNRQIRVTGKVDKCSSEVSDNYFASRPLKSRIGAWVSDQSQAIPSRIYLMRKFAEFGLKNLGQTIKRPAHWGGYQLTPDYIEFWQGRPNRLHDRIEFKLEEGQWQSKRLAP